MTPVQLEYIKQQTSKLLASGYSQDDIVSHVLAQPQFKNLLMSERDALALAVIEATSVPKIRSQVTATATTSVIQPDFPVVQTFRGKGGAINEVVIPNHPENLKYLITNVLGMNPEFNDLKRRVYNNGVSLEDADIGNIRNRCREYALSDSKDFVVEVLVEMARANRYSPFLRALENVVWDQHDHIKDLFGTLTLTTEAAPHADWYYEYIRRWLIGVCAKVMNPGDQNLVLTFKSKQGDGKSRWLKKLASVAPEIFGEDEVDTSNKDHVLRHINYIIWHIPEIDGSMRKADAAALKSYLTMSDIAVREAYARFDTVKNSCLSFVASVNGDEFLVDDSGSRRYLVMDLADLNPDHNVNIVQVWAQAMHLFKSGERHWFDKNEITKINELNENFQTKNYVDHLASQIQDGDDWLSAVEIFAHYLGKPYPTQTDINKLQRLLNKRGFEKKRPSIKGDKITKYKVHKPEKPIF
jgi:predicted P-loop ATPase